MRLKQVRQRKQRDELRGVLLQAAIARLQKAELAFDDAEGMLDLGADAGLGVLDDFEQPAQLGVRRTTAS